MKKTGIPTFIVKFLTDICAAYVGHSFRDIFRTYILLGFSPTADIVQKSNAYLSSPTASPMYPLSAPPPEF